MDFSSPADQSGRIVAIAATYLPTSDPFNCFPRYRML
jgi:hypothetical protein